MMEGGKFLWNDGIFSPDHTVSHPWFSYFRRKNLISLFVSLLSFVSLPSGIVLLVVTLPTSSWVVHFFFFFISWFLSLLVAFPRVFVPWMEIALFLYVKLCSSVDTPQRFRGTSCLIAQSSGDALLWEVCFCFAVLSSDFLLILSFFPPHDYVFLLHFLIIPPLSFSPFFHSCFPLQTVPKLLFLR